MKILKLFLETISPPASAFGVATHLSTTITEAPPPPITNKDIKKVFEVWKAKMTVDILMLGFYNVELSRWTL